MQERIVWIAVVLVLAISLIATGLDSPDDKNITKNPMRHPDSVVAEDPISIPERIYYNTGNGSRVVVPLGADYFTIIPGESNTGLEVAIREGELSGKGQLQNGPDDWKVMIHEGWDSDPETTQMGNSSRTFFKQGDNFYIEAVQYDYTGGKYDTVFEQMLKRIDTKDITRY